MISLPANLSEYSRPDLITWVASTCVILPHHSPGSLESLREWCEHEWGEVRAGNILYEALDGWIDYFDGDWQIAFNPFLPHDEMILWVSDQTKLTQYCLTWT